MFALLIIPIITAIICYNLKAPRLIGFVSLAGVAVLAVSAFPVIAASMDGTVSALEGAFFMDALSGYIMALVIFLSFASAAYSISYLEHELDAGLMNLRGVRTYYGLLHLFIFTMLW
jgi:hydrogenase-4 component F